MDIQTTIQNLDLEGNGKWDNAEPFTDLSNQYRVISPLPDEYKEKRFLIFNFSPDAPGYIEDDQPSWEENPKWNFPVK